MYYYSLRYTRSTGNVVDPCASPRAAVSRVVVTNTVLPSSPAVQRSVGRVWSLNIRGGSLCRTGSGATRGVVSVATRVTHRRP